MAALGGILFIVIGLATCFFGKRIYRVVLALMGFVIGFGAASAGLAQQAELIRFVVALVVGLVLALIFWSLYKFAYVMFGIILGIALASLVISGFNIQGLIALIIVVVLAIAGGVVGTTLADLMIRLGTAFSGASAAVSGVGALGAAIGISLPLVNMTGGATAATNSTAGIISIIAVIILGVVGFYFQTTNDTGPI